MPIPLPPKTFIFYLKIKICYFSNNMEELKKGILSINILFYILKKYEICPYFTILYYESKIFKEEVAEIPNLRGRCALVWHKCHVSDDPKDSKLCLLAQYRFSALCPVALTPLEEISANLEQTCSATRAFQKCKILGVQKFEGSKF